MLNKNKPKIEIFDSQIKLDNVVIDDMIKEFQKPGLLLISAGRTFENSIYPKISDLYACSQNPQESFFLHPDLIVSHVDERVTDDENLQFSKIIKNKLSILGNKFKPIDIDSAFDQKSPVDELKPNEQELKKIVFEFDRLIKSHGGPRIIYLGLGEDPQIAHIAYIGEDGLNPTTQIVNLSNGLRKAFKIDRAITIGTDIFNSPNLERIIVVIKGFHKARSLKNSFENPDTGFGYLMENHSDKLYIYSDVNACKLIMN